MLVTWIGCVTNICWLKATLSLKSTGNKVCKQFRRGYIICIMMITSHKPFRVNFHNNTNINEFHNKSTNGHPKQAWSQYNAGAKVTNWWPQLMIVLHRYTVTLAHSLRPSELCTVEFTWVVSKYQWHIQSCSAKTDGREIRS